MKEPKEIERKTQVRRKFNLQHRMFRTKYQSQHEKLLRTKEEFLRTTKDFSIFKKFLKERLRESDKIVRERMKIQGESKLFLAKIKSRELRSKKGKAKTILKRQPVKKNLLKKNSTNKTQDY